jgi:DNA (cytosine-5)-methyltransferase 1
MTQKKSKRSFLDSYPSVLKKMSTNISVNEGTAGTGSVTDPHLSFEYQRNSETVSRTVFGANGSAFTTRLDLPKGVSRRQDARSMFDQAFLKSGKGCWHRPLRGEMRVADLYSGCGGLSLGAREACIAFGRNFKSVLAVDKDKDSRNVYTNNFSPQVFHDEDIWKLLTGEIGKRLNSGEKSLAKRIGRIDVLLAGPPCQGHSDLNNYTRRDDKRNHLYERVARFAEVATPSHLIIENVPTVIHGKDKSLDRTLNRLRELNYNVSSQVVNLELLGVPQRRKRHVVIASLKKPISIDSVIARNSVSKERSLKWAISDLEQEEAVGIFRTPSVLHRTNLQRIDYLMENDIYDLPNHLRPICHQDEHSYVSMYGRLHYDKPAQTITSGFGSPGQGRYIHPTQRRTLLPHEAARVQFFPDSFDFSSVTLRTALANMLGNAVPMLLAYVFCLEFLSNAYLI